MTSNFVKQNINYVLNIKLLKLCFILCMFFNYSLFAQSSNCLASLNVEKDRNIRSTPPDGTYYSMVLSNKSSTINTYVLDYENLKLNCQNPDNSSTAKNVTLEINFLDKNLKSINEITISPGTEIKFFVHITVPKNTNSNSWCCTEIIARSKNCSGYKVNTTLKTFVMNLE